MDRRQQPHQKNYKLTDVNMAAKDWITDGQVARMMTLNTATWTTDPTVSFGVANASHGPTFGLVVSTYRGPRDTA